jgi:hypothetical protein
MTLAPVTTQATLSAIVTDATRRYFATRHARVDACVDRHLSVRGSLRLHRHALGWDIVRSPVNLTFAAPQALLLLGASAARRFGASRAEELLRNWN